MEPFRLGIVGAGRMARLHLDVFKVFEDVDVVALASPGEARRSAVAAEYRIAHTHASTAGMLAAGGLDGVVVSPSVEHVFDVASACLTARLHTLVEKPPGLTVAETETLARQAQDAGVCAIVGLQRRYYSHILSGLAEIRRRGPLYSVVIEAPEHFTQIRGKRKFTDAVLSQWMVANGIHLIDLFRLVGGHIRSVTSAARTWRETITADSFHAMIEFESGAIGQYISNWSSPGGWSLTAYGADCRVDIKPMERGSILIAGGQPEELPIAAIDTQCKPGLYAQNRAFIDAARGETSPPWPAVTIADAVDTMELVTMVAAGRSGRFQRRT